MSNTRFILNPQFRFFNYNGKHYGFMPAKDHPLAYATVSSGLRELLESFRTPRRMDAFANDTDASYGLTDFLKLARARGVLVSEDYKTAKTDPGIPNRLTFLPTMRCNLRCVYCYSEAGDHSSTDLPVEMAEAAVRKLVDMQPRDSKEARAISIGYLGGGEPTLRMDLLKHVNNVLTPLAEERNLKVHYSIVSNGTFSDTIREWLLENKFTISFSLDGPLDIQNRQRPTRSGGPSYERIAENIRRVAEVQENINTRATVTPSSIPRMKEIVEHALELGATSIHLEPCSDESGRAKFSEGHFSLDTQAFVDEFLNIFPWAMENEIMLFTTGLLSLRPGTGSYCGMNNPNLFVTPSGELSCCPEVCEQRHPAASAFIYGKLNQDGSFTRDAEKVKRLCERIGSNIEACKGCFLETSCGGSCAARAFCNTGNAFNHDPVSCHVNKEMGARLISAIAEERFIPGDEAWLPRRARCAQGEHQGTLVSMIPKLSPLRKNKMYRPIVQLLKKGPAFTLETGAAL